MNGIAVVGEFASGKTTLANELVEVHGFTRVSFAARLKELAAHVYNHGRPIEKTASYIVHPLDTLGDEALSGRQLLQELGQSVKTMDQLFWVHALMADIDAGHYGEGPFVSDDCRFPYEAEALKARGFLVVRVMTPEYVRLQRYELLYGRQPTLAERNHPSETAVRSISYDVLVDGTAPPKLTAAYLVGLTREDAA